MYAALYFILLIFYPPVDVWGKTAAFQLLESFNHCVWIITIMS